MKSKELCRTPWRWGPDMNLAVETEVLTFMWTWHVFEHCARLWWKCLSHNLSRRSLRYTTKVNKKVSRRSFLRRFVVPSTPKRYQRYPSKKRSSECPKWLRPWLRRWSRIRRCFCSWQICEGKPRIWLGWSIHTWPNKGFLHFSDHVTMFSVVLGPSCGSAKACGPTQSRAEHLVTFREIPIYVVKMLLNALYWHVGVSENGGFPPKSSILIGTSIINCPFWGPLFLETPMSCQLAIWGIKKVVEEEIVSRLSWRLECCSVSWRGSTT